MNFSPFPEIKSELIRLRKMEESDDCVILHLRSDETINQLVERPEKRKTKTIAQAIEFIKGVNEDFENNKSVSWGITY
jgi:ribosomal-protein-alanine N-acetyltransferase